MDSRRGARAGTALAPRNRQRRSAEPGTGRRRPENLIASASTTFDHVTQRPGAPSHPRPAWPARGRHSPRPSGGGRVHPPRAGRLRGGHSSAQLDASLVCRMSHASWCFAFIWRREPLVARLGSSTGLTEPLPMRSSPASSRFEPEARHADREGRALKASGKRVKAYAWHFAASVFWQHWCRSQVHRPARGAWHHYVIHLP